MLLRRPQAAPPPATTIVITQTRAGRELFTITTPRRTSGSASDFGHLQTSGGAEPDRFRPTRGVGMSIGSSDPLAPSARSRPSIVSVFCSLGACHRAVGGLQFLQRLVPLLLPLLIGDSGVAFPAGLQGGLFGENVSARACSVPA